MEGGGEFAAGGDAEFGVGVLEVVVDGAHRQLQPVGDVLAAGVGGGEESDFAFAGGERGGERRGGQQSGTCVLAAAGDGGCPAGGSGGTAGPAGALPCGCGCRGRFGGRQVGTGLLEYGGDGEELVSNSSNCPPRPTNTSVKPGAVTGPAMVTGRLPR